MAFVLNFGEWGTIFGTIATGPLMPRDVSVSAKFTVEFVGTTSDPCRRSSVIELPGMVKVTLPGEVFLH